MTNTEKLSNIQALASYLDDLNGETDEHFLPIFIAQTKDNKDEDYVNVVKTLYEWAKEV